MIVGEKHAGKWTKRKIYWPINQRPGQEIISRNEMIRKTKTKTGGDQKKKAGQERAMRFRQ